MCRLCTPFCFLPGALRGPLCDKHSRSEQVSGQRAADQMRGPCNCSLLDGVFGPDPMQGLAIGPRLQVRAATRRGSQPIWVPICSRVPLVCNS